MSGKPLLRFSYVHMEGIMDMSLPLTERLPFNKILVPYVRQYNASYTPYTKIGNAIDGEGDHYDGCTGSMQRNETDIGLIIRDFPFVGPNITNMNVVAVDQLVIASVYNKTQPEEQESRVLDFVYGYSLSVWLISAVLMFMLSLLLMHALTRKKRKRRFRHNRVTDAPVAPAVLKPEINSKMKAKLLKILTACLLKQYSACPYVPLGVFVTGIFMAMVALSFFTGFFLTSMIRTEMMVIKNPATIDSYEDILAEEDVIPLWLTELDDHQNFERAPSGSKERRIWDRAVAHGLNNSMLSITETKNLAQKLMKIATRKAVSITNHYSTISGVSNACAYARQTGQLPGMTAWMKSDPSAPETLKGFVASVFSPPKLTKHFTDLMTRAVEMDVIRSEILRNFRFFLVPSPVGKVFAQVEECKSNVMVLPDPHVGDAPFAHYSDLLALTALLYLLATVVHYNQPLLHLLVLACGKIHTALTRLSVSLSRGLLILRCRLCAVFRH